MNTKRFFFVMIGVFVISVALGVAGFVWTNKLLKKEASGVSTLMAEKEALDYKINLLKKSYASLDDVDELKSLVSAVLPSEKRQEDLLADIIFTASAEAGIPSNKIQNIAFTTSSIPDKFSGTTALKDVQGVYAYPFTLQVKKIPYTTLLKFLSEIEKNKRIIQVENIQITPNETDPTRIESVALSLKTFVRP